MYLLGLWDDFIPKMGTWLHSGTDTQTGAIVGYLWRYFGDGGGIGIAFFLIALALGLQHRSRRTVLAAFVNGAVFPVWAGSSERSPCRRAGNTTCSPHDEDGHAVADRAPDLRLVLGLGFLRARSTLGRHWPWPPLLAGAAGTDGSDR